MSSGDGNVPPPQSPPRRLTPDQRNTAIAKKMFYGGCFLLPWLWILNLIYFRASFRSPTASPQLKGYLKKSLAGTLLVTMAFVLWVSVFHAEYKSWGSTGRDLLVVDPDDTSLWWLKR